MVFEDRPVVFLSWFLLGAVFGFFLAVFVAPPASHVHPNPPAFDFTETNYPAGGSG